MTALRRACRFSEHFHIHSSILFSEQPIHQGREDWHGGESSGARGSLSNPIPESPQPPICLLDSAWFLLGTVLTAPKAAQPTVLPGTSPLLCRFFFLFFKIYLSERQGYREK